MAKNDVGSKGITVRFDVFISCRKTGDDGRATRDSLLARNVYDFLTARGMLCFLAEESLLTMGQAEYKKAIDEVLDHVPVLVVVATSPENLESKWVRYEWDSFYNDILGGVKRGTLLSYLDGVDVKALPRTLRQTQAIQHSEGALQILSTHISSALGLRQVDDLTRSGQVAVDRLDRLTEVMAESRLLELEITSGMFGMLLSADQTARMQRQIETLKNILKERSSQTDPATGTAADGEEPCR